MKKPMYAVINDINDFLLSADENVIITGTADEGEMSYPHNVLCHHANSKADAALVMECLGGVPLMKQIYTEWVGNVHTFAPMKRVPVTQFMGE